MTRVDVEVNGSRYAADVEPRTLLSDFLRDSLELTGTHVGCEQGVCGSCTVQIDGKPARSCLALAVQADGASIRTVEGLAPANGEGLHPIQRAFHEHHALQCGFCTPGFLTSIDALLPEFRGLTDTELRQELAGNLCRCTGYQNIVEATRSAMPDSHEVVFEHEVPAVDWAALDDAPSAWRGEVAGLRGFVELLDVDADRRIAHFDVRAREVDGVGQIRGILKASAHDSSVGVRADLEFIGTSTEPDIEALTAMLDLAAARLAPPRADAPASADARSHRADAAHSPARAKRLDPRWIAAALALALLALVYRRRR